MVKVLFLAANPAATTKLALDEEIRAIDAKIQGARYRDNLELVSHWAVQLDDLSGLLLRHRPDVVHFSGHGSSAGGLILNNATRDLGPADDADAAAPGGPRPPEPMQLPAEALGRLFGVLRDNVRVVVLNACYSEVQAQAIVRSIDCAVGMSGPIRDDHAIAFAAEFYQALAYGRSVREAFDLGVVRLQNAGYPQAEALVRLHHREGADPSQVVLIAEPRGLIGQPGGNLPPQPRPTPEAAAVRESIIRFNVQFQQRQQEFRYLNANKELHDVLHQLQNFHPRIRSFAEALRRLTDSSGDLDPTEIADSLQDWATKARKCAADTDVPEQPLRWVARFERAANELVTELSKADATTIVARTLDRAIEVLGNLPAQEQPRLNEKLVACALRLKTDELLGSIDQVIRGLDASGLGWGELRANFQTFGGLCEQLSGLIRDHNLCQDVDGALREAAGLPEITPDQLSQWEEIKQKLQDLLGRHPDDPRARRPVESTGLFETAAAAGDKRRTAQAFQRLLERFDDLFFHTDEALRETTRDLLTTVSLLDATLKGFLS